MTSLFVVVKMVQTVVQVLRLYHKFIPLLNTIFSSKVVMLKRFHSILVAKHRFLGCFVSRYDQYLPGFRIER